MHEDTITVGGVAVDYRRRGAGPPLLLIPGGSGDGGVFGPFADRLAARFDVVSASSRIVSAHRRGREIGEQRPEAHAADALGLIDALFDRPPVVFGSSSGAITALELLSRHPERVALAVAHEPPLVGLLPDAQARRAALTAVRDTARTEGAAAATALMRQAMAAVDAAQEGLAVRRTGEWFDGYGDTAAEPPTPELLAVAGRLGELQPAFLERVLVPFATHPVGLDALKATGRLVPAAGIDSRGELPYRAAAALAARTGLPLTEFPGGHLGPVERPTQFAAALRALAED
ncbi:MAG TPA: alpha/beta hydrolase [Glycomyces sp.]|nr:alpha/beta hydrolase [Glycomyces sp.]